MCYGLAMTKDTITAPAKRESSPDRDAGATQADAAHTRVLEMAHTSAMEGNPMSEAHLALFEKFRRERWTDEQIEAHIDELLRDLAAPNG